MIDNNNSILYPTDNDTLNFVVRDRLFIKHISNFKNFNNASDFDIIFVTFSKKYFKKQNESHTNMFGKYTCVKFICLIDNFLFYSL